MLKIDSEGNELCPTHGEDVDGVLVERSGVCSKCDAEVIGVE